MKLMHSQNQREQAGFGIIEIMIALALGVIIMLGITQIATNNSSIRYELDDRARQMENAAFALREIESDLTSAAFWGEKSEESPGAFPSVCPATSAGLVESMGYPVQGWQLGKALGSNAFDCDNLGAIAPEVGTDYLAVRRVSSCAINDPDDPDCAPADANFHLQVHSCTEDSTDAGSFEVSNVLADFTYLQRDCDSDAPIYRFQNRIYYIKINPNDPDNPQLMRAELVGTDYTTTALVDGVEGLFLEYGMDRDADGQIDTDEDGITVDPTEFPAGSGTEVEVEWANVVMVRVSLVVHNSKPSTGFEDDQVYTIAGGQTYCVDDPGDDDDDAFDGPCDLDIPAAFENRRRQVYSRTVSLRNVAGRREEAP